MKKLIRSVWNNEFYQGGIVLTSGSFVINFLNYLFSILTAKSLGPNGFGEISALLSYIAVCSLPFTIFTSIVIQKISAIRTDRKNYSLSLEYLFITKTKKILLFFIPLIVVIPFLPRFTNLSILSSYTLVPLIVLNLITSFYMAANNGLRLFFLITITNVGAAVFKFSGAVLTYFHIDGITTIISFLFLSALFSLITNYFFFHNKTKQINTKIKKIEKSIVSIVLSRQFLIFALSAAGISLFGTIDIIFVKKFFSAEIAGIYSSWSLFSKIILYVVGPLISLSFIFFSSTETRNQQRKVFIVSLILLLFIGLAGYLVYTNFAQLLIAIFFGERFNSVMQYLGRASIFGSLYTAILFMNNYFLSKKSLASLILPFGLPIYIGFLIAIPRHLTNVMDLNIIFSGAVIIMYLLVFAAKNFLFVSNK